MLHTSSSALSANNPVLTTLAQRDALLRATPTLALSLALAHERRMVSMSPVPQTDGWGYELTLLARCWVFAINLLPIFPMKLPDDKRLALISQ
jgi:hypothetical protein